MYCKIGPPRALRTHCLLLTLMMNIDTSSLVFCYYNLYNSGGNFHAFYKPYGIRDYHPTCPNGRRYIWYVPPVSTHIASQQCNCFILSLHDIGHNQKTNTWKLTSENGLIMKTMPMSWIWKSCYQHKHMLFYILRQAMINTGYFMRKNVHNECFMHWECRETCLYLVVILVKKKQIGGWSARNGTTIPKSYTRAWRPNKEDNLFVSIKC